MQAVLFDLDGTLLDTLADLAESMNSVLTARSLPLHDNEAYKLFVGDGVEALVARSLPPQLRDEKTLRACVDDMRSEYMRRWNRNSRPYPGIAELLTVLTQRRVKIAVLSNKPQAMTELCVDKLLEGFVFEQVRGARPGTPKKPDPAAALEIAEASATPPSDWLYLGDTGTDMKTAVAAGMHPVGALWGFRGAAELEENGARSLIASPLELLDLTGPPY